MGKSEDDTPEDAALALAQARLEYEDAKHYAYAAQQRCRTKRAELAAAQQRYERACAQRKRERAPQAL